MPTGTSADRVVDASVLAAYAFMEPRAEEARKLIGGKRLYAPSLLWDELTNVALVKIRRHPAERSAILAGLALALAVEIRPVRTDPIEVIALAEQFDLTAYDAAYAWVARETGADLVTFDRRLAMATRRLP